MATIKLTAEGKVIIKDGKPSCDCCGVLCSIFDLDLLLYTLHYGGYVLAGYTFDIEGDLFQQGALTLEGYLVQPKRKLACLRWLCREVVVSGGVIVSESNTEFGGPTENNKDLWVDICEPLFGDETHSGTFLYVIEFCGWQGGTVSPRYWISADDEYYVTKYFVTKQ
jgi:hypothetical protein